jgi:zinc protease
MLLKSTTRSVPRFAFLLFILSIITLLTHPFPAQGGSSTKLFKATLDNGLTVILEENHSAPVVALQMWVKVGGADDTDDESGLAHTLEHMIFKGTEKRGVGQIAKEIESMGGDINAWTSYDETVYHIVVASRFHEEGLDVLADAIQNSVFDLQELEKEKMVVLEELRRGEDSPSRKLGKRLMSTAYTSHPYTRPVIGLKETVQSLDREKTFNFYKKWYVPNNMTLVVSGDFDNEDFFPRVKEAFKNFSRGPDPHVVQRPKEPVQDGMRTAFLSDDVQETHLELAFHIPRLNHGDVYAIDVLSTILGGGRSSRLYRKVKAEQALVRSISTYAMTPKDPGLFFISANLEAEQLAETFKASIEELEKIKAEGVTDEELERTKLNLESDFIYQRGTIQGRASQLGYYETVAGDLSFEKKYIEGINGVTSEDIKKVAKKYFKGTNLTLAILVPESKKAFLDKGKYETIASLLGDESKEETQITKKVLENGITLLIRENHDNPTVSFYGVFRGALLTEDEDNNGITNFIARMLSKGTDTKDAEEIARVVESMAGGLSGFSGKNTFGASGKFLSRFFDDGLEIFSDILLNPSFDDEEIEKTRKDILLDIRTEEDSLPRTTFNLLYKTLYQKHPYRLNPLGTAETVSKISQKDMIKYYQKLAIPQNLVLAVVGDVETETVEEKINELFGGLKKGKPLNLNVPEEHQIEKLRTAELIKEKEQTHIAMGFLGTRIDSPDRYPMDVLANVLATQGGRLFVELRDKKGLAYVVTALSREGIGTGSFVVYMATSPENLERSIRGMKDVLRGVINEKVTEEELQKSKRHLIGSYEIGLQNNSSQASDMAINEILGLGYDEFKRYPDKISGVTLEDVQRVAQKYLDLDSPVLTIVRPPKSDI